MTPEQILALKAKIESFGLKGISFLEHIQDQRIELGLHFAGSYAEAVDPHLRGILQEVQRWHRGNGNHGFVTVKLFFFNQKKEVKGGCRVLEYSSRSWRPENGHPHPELAIARVA